MINSEKEIDIINHIEKIITNFNRNSTFKYIKSKTGINLTQPPFAKGIENPFLDGPERADNLNKLRDWNYDKKPKLVLEALAKHICTKYKEDIKYLPKEKQQDIAGFLNSISSFAEMIQNEKYNAQDLKYHDNRKHSLEVALNAYFEMEKINEQLLKENSSETFNIHDFLLIISVCAAHDLGLSKKRPVLIYNNMVIDEGVFKKSIKTNNYNPDNWISLGAIKIEQPVFFPESSFIFGDPVFKNAKEKVYEIPTEDTKYAIEKRVSGADEALSCFYLEKTFTENNINNESIEKARAILYATPLSKYKNLEAAIVKKDFSKLNELDKEIYEPIFQDDASLINKYGLQLMILSDLRSSLTTARDQTYDRTKEVAYEVGYTDDIIPFGINFITNLVPIEIFKTLPTWSYLKYDINSVIKYWEEMKHYQDEQSIADSAREATINNGKESVIGS